MVRPTTYMVGLTIHMVPPYLAEIEVLAVITASNIYIPAKVTSLRHMLTLGLLHSLSISSGTGTVQNCC